MGLIAFEFMEHKEDYMALLNSTTTSSTSNGSNIEMSNRNSANVTESTPLNKRPSRGKATRKRSSSDSSNVESIIELHPTLNRLSYLLKPYFDKYDVDHSGYLDLYELGTI